MSDSGRTSSARSRAGRESGRSGKLLAVAAAFALLAALAWAEQAFAENCRAVDGDSLLCGSERVRLHDVYAAEFKQTGGRAAKRNLEALVRHREVVLQRRGKDRHGRTLADAYVDGRKIVQSDIGPRAGNGVKSGYASRR